MKKVVSYLIINFIMIILTSVCYANRYYDEDFEEYGDNSGGFVLVIIVILYFWVSGKILNFLQDYGMEDITLTGLNLLIILAVAWFFLKGIIGLIIYSIYMYVIVRFFTKSFYAHFILVLIGTFIYGLAIKILK